MSANLDHFLGVANKHIDSQFIVISNKGMMKFRAGESSDINVIFKHVNLKDLAQKDNGAQKIHDYFDNYRIGYVNADGKHKINSKLMNEINVILANSKKEVPNTDKALSNAPTESHSPAESKPQSTHPTFEVMDEKEYKDFEKEVLAMVNQALEKQKTKKPESDNGAQKFQSGPVKGDKKEKFVRNVEKKMNETKSKILDKFSENSKDVQARKDEAYQKDQIKQDQIKQDIKTEDRKKWDRKVEDNKIGGG